jgi:addiction module HigA family antidote
MIRLPKGEPTSPGEMLVEEFLKPLGLNARQLALGIKVPPNRVTQIIKGTRAITPDTALRFARYFDMTPGFWLNLQLVWDLWHAVHGEHSAEIEGIEPLQRAS